jgi:hypothetical protein
MSDRQRMNEDVTAESVKSTFSYSGGGGTPGKAAGGYDGDKFVAEAMDSADNTIPWPSLPQYWNVNGTSRDTDVKNRQP